MPVLFEELSDILKPERFYVDAHQRIYAAMQKVNDAGIMIEALAVIDQLRRSEELEIVGGPYYVMKLTRDVVNTANAEAYAKIIQQKYIQRELITIAGTIIGEAYEDSADALDLVDKAEERISGIINQTSTVNYQTSAQLSSDVVKRMQHLRENPGSLSGVPTGFTPLDKITNGWQPTDLIIIAARPSVGKTAFALNLARNAATNPFKPTPVGLFSIEMSGEQLWQRVISSHGQIPLDRITNGRMSDEDDFAHFLTVSEKVGKLPIYIDSSAALNILEFRSRARRMVHKHGVGLIIIDYLQLMSGLRSRNNDNREQEIATITRNLKALAKELKIPIIALSQLTRAVETQNRVPQLSDLRESGAIEQDADMVMFLTRPTYQKMDKDVDPVMKDDAEAWIKKHRNGALDKILFKTVLSIQRWFDLQQHDDYLRRRAGMIPVAEADANFMQVVPPADDGEELPF